MATSGAVSLQGGNAGGVASASAPANLLLARGRTEPTIAVDPHNPSTIVVSANTNYSQPVGGTYPTAFFDSHDGGTSFATGLAPLASGLTTGADTTVTVAADGTVFYSLLAEAPAYCANGGSSVLLTHSTDHGRSFHAPTVVDSNPADDKPNMAVESVPGHSAHIFITWTRWHDASSDVMFARSTDGGSHFSPPRLLWTSPLDNFGTVPVVGPGGRVYVFWSVFPESSLTVPAPTGLFVVASANDGVSFGERQKVTPTFQAVPRMVKPGYLRDLTMPAVTAGRDGTLYAAWAAATHRYPDGHVDAGILLSRSLNQGRTWSRPHAVNDSGSGARFMPAMSLLGRDGVGLAYYDQRAGGRELDVYAARVSFAGGFHASANVRVNAGPSPVSDITYIPPDSTCFAPGRFFGDYIGVAPRKGRLCVVWADTQSRMPNQTDIWYASVDLPRG